MSLTQIPIGMLGFSPVLKDGDTLTGALNFATTASVASLSTVDLSAIASNSVIVTGTTTITSLGTLPSGAERKLIFSGALTLTHNATSLILLTGADITTAADDVASFVSLGSGNWRMTSYSRANGQALVGGLADGSVTTAKLADANVTTAKIADANVTPAKLSQPLTRATAVSASGTAVEWTSIPSWAKRITVMFKGVSTNGTSNIQVQLGSGSYTTSGYLGSVSIVGASSVATFTFTTGFGIHNAAGTAFVGNGNCVINNINGNDWCASTHVARSDAAANLIGAGSVSLGGTLDRIRVTTVNGTDSFDAGTINILYE